MRTLPALLLVAFSLCASATEVRFDHYDPVALNEAAAASVQAGDLTTAWILLERAARLAPSDTRIAANLQWVRARLTGEKSLEKNNRGE